MNTKILALSVVILVSACFIPGCILVNSDFLQIKNLILDEIGQVDVKTEFQLQVGSGLISLGGIAVSFTDAKDEVCQYLRDIKNVQVGVYRLEDMSRRRPIVIPDKIGNKLARKGYEPMVRVKERDSAVWVMTKMRGKRIESLYVIALDRSELVLVEVQGRLERLIEKAIREHGFRKGEFMNI
jgi:hypothetical protein